MRIFAVRFERNEVLIREHSSVGLEHLPYKQRVGGSTPSAPTTKPWIRPRLFSLFCANVLHLSEVLQVENIGFCNYLCNRALWNYGIVSFAGGERSFLG